MWLAEGKKNLSLQMVQIYKLQKQPLVQIYNYQSKLIFGSYNEPIERMAFSYVDNSYKTYMFLSRNDENAKHGIIPALYETFYFNRIADLKIFGPKNVLFFLSLIHQIMGPKISAFPVLEMHKDGTYISKYGIKQKQQQELTNFLKIQNKQYFDVGEINKNMKTYVKDYIDPLSFVQDGFIQFDKNMQIIPIHQSMYLIQYTDDNLIQYLLKQTPTNDMKEARFILILNLQLESECEEFIEVVLPKIKILIQQIENKFIVIHQANENILESPSYKKIVDELQFQKPEIINIVASMNYFKDIHKLERQEMYRDKSNLYHLEYLVQMKECIPQLFEGRGQINKFTIKNDLPLKNIDYLWSKNYNKVLSSNYRSIDLQKDFITFEKIKQARDIRFIPHNLDLQKLKFYAKNIPIGQSHNFKLTILGTSSSILTIRRSTSSYLLNLKGFDILLDCGQCTLFQIYHSSDDDEKFKQKLIDLKLIFISHFHIDHHGGLYELLEKRYQLTKLPIQLIIPNNLFLWLHFSLTTLIQNNEGHSDYQKYFQIYSHRQFSDNFYNMFGPSVQIPKFDSQQVHNMNSVKEYLEKYNIEFKLINTQHCKHSMGIRIQQYGKTIVYSADRAAQNQQLQKEFVEQAMDCDLLIHECTYPESEIEKASQNNHSTFYHAVNTAKKCNAGMLLLTHFSSGMINKLKSHFDSEGQVDVALCPEYYEYVKFNTIFANDFMSITDKNMQLLPQVSRLIFSLL